MVYLYVGDLDITVSLKRTTAMSKNKKLVRAAVFNQMLKTIQSGEIVTNYPVLYGGVRITDKFDIENSIYIYMECGCFLAN